MIFDQLFAQPYGHPIYWGRQVLGDSFSTLTIAFIKVILSVFVLGNILAAAMSSRSFIPVVVAGRPQRSSLIKIMLSVFVMKRH